MRLLACAFEFDQAGGMLLRRSRELTGDAVCIYGNCVDFEKPKLQAVIERDGQLSVLPDAKE